jgi:hypothetical protein
MTATGTRLGPNLADQAQSACVGWLRGDDSVSRVPTDYERTYAERFRRYTAHTDGKRKLAEIVREFAASRNLRYLLDLGAGDGELTRHLVGAFDESIAVDRNAAFRAPLCRVGVDRCLMQSMEHVDYAMLRYDCVLLSYSLNGFRGEQLAHLLDQLQESILPGGRFLLCTEANTGRWHSFAGAVSELLDLDRASGSSSDVARLQEIGITPTKLATVQTQIWGDSVSDLASTLSCFFMKVLGSYDYQDRRVAELLADYTVPLSSGGVKLIVEESVYEFSPPQQ